MSKALLMALEALGHKQHSDLDGVYLAVEGLGILYPHESTPGYKLLGEGATSNF